MPSTKLWTTVSGFESLPPSQLPRFHLGRWLLGRSCGVAARLAPLAATGTKSLPPSQVFNANSTNSQLAKDSEASKYRTSATMHRELASRHVYRTDFG